MRFVRLSGIMVLVTSIGMALLVAAELVVRRIDGYPLLSLAVPLFAVGAQAPTALMPLAAMAKQLPTSPETDASWIDEPPPTPLLSPADPALVARKNLPRSPRVEEFDLYNAWNRAWIEKIGCTTYSSIPFLPMPITVFDSPSGSIYPTYRYLAGKTTPLGLTTNQWGFRGPEIALDKPAQTVRIAFLGASTTVGSHSLPHAYPEYTIDWLNRWAFVTKRRVRFEAINAGRHGIGSTAIATILQDEVLPFEPDVVVYYEGANQFIFSAPLTDVGQDAPLSAKGRPNVHWRRFAEKAARYSALVRRLDKLATIIASRNGGEPTKPPYVLAWPANIDEQAPDLDSPDLPLTLPTILGDLNAIRNATAHVGATLVMSSFVWLVSDGLRLDPVRQASIYGWLNERCWPYRYADLRKLVDFQNRVLRRWADAQDLPFLDVAAAFSTDPRLFVDAIHFTPDGTRLHGWIVFQQLLPLLQKQLDAGTLPRPDRVPLSTHPGFGATHEYLLPCAKSRSAG